MKRLHFANVMTGKLPCIDKGFCVRRSNNDNNVAQLILHANFVNKREELLFNEILSVFETFEGGSGMESKGIEIKNPLN